MVLDSIFNEECLGGMQRIENGTVDLILCDLPYGTTQNCWDSIIPLSSLWAQYLRVLKPNGAVILTSMQPFTSQLVSSNPKLFKYELIWEKNISTGHLNVSKQPLRKHESVLVFYSKQPTYNPQKTFGAKPYKPKGGGSNGTNYGKFGQFRAGNEDGSRFPTSILKFDCEKGLHPTQKPVALFEYLIKTYSNEGDVVLDSCLGSGTTAVAAKRCGRHYVGFELNPEYYAVAQRRVLTVG